MQLINKSKQYDAVMKLPFAVIGLDFDDEVLVRVDYLESGISPMASTNKTIQYVCNQINDYCTGTLKDSQFDVSIRISGTDFQIKVWSQLQKIAYGQVRTYGDLAKQLKTSPRAVGNACRANPVALLVPCHRVISASGMGGYSGETDGSMVAIKRWLLEREKTAQSDSHKLILSSW